MSAPACPRCRSSSHVVHLWRSTFECVACFFRFESPPLDNERDRLRDEKRP